MKKLIVYHVPLVAALCFVLSGCDSVSQKVPSKEGKESGSSAETAESVLAGSVTHDFGERKVVEGARLQHVFTLTNTSSDAVRIRSVKQTCGCVTAHASVDMVAPGESVDVTVEMKMKLPGRRMEAVMLGLSNGEVQKLVLTVYGTTDIQYFVSAGALRLDVDTSQEELLVAEAAGDFVPSEPHIRCTDPRIRWSVGKWTEDFATSTQPESTLRRWTCNVRVRRSPDEIVDDDTSLIVTFDGYKRAFVLNLVGLPVFDKLAANVEPGASEPGARTTNDLH